MLSFQEYIQEAGSVFKNDFDGVTEDDVKKILKKNKGIGVVKFREAGRKVIAGVDKKTKETVFKWFPEEFEFVSDFGLSELQRKSIFK